MVKAKGLSVSNFKHSSSSGMIGRGLTCRVLVEFFIPFLGVRTVANRIFLFTKSIFSLSSPWASFGLHPVNLINVKIGRCFSGINSKMWDCSSKFNSLIVDF